MISEMIKDYWHIAIGALAFVAGYSKLREKAETTSEELKSLESRVNMRRAEDLDRMEKMVTEIRTDVKLLLQRGSQ